MDQRTPLGDSGHDESFGEAVAFLIEVGIFFFFQQKTAYEIPLCDWSSDVCSSDLPPAAVGTAPAPEGLTRRVRGRPRPRTGNAVPEIGRASCRERVYSGV